MGARPAQDKHERRNAILATLRSQPALRVQELALKFAVTTETIRRDLDALHQAGHLSRTYGGATARPYSFEPSLGDRSKLMIAERTAIAAETAKLIKPGDSLMIDAGATTVHCAHQLAAQFKKLTVLTNSFAVAFALSVNPTIKIVVVPGEFDGAEGAILGSEAIAFLKAYRADKAIVGSTGISCEGLHDANREIAAVKRAMIKRASSVICVADHEKFDRVSLVTVAPLAEIDCIVTDQWPTGELANAIQAAKVSVRCPQEAEKSLSASERGRARRKGGASTRGRNALQCEGSAVVDLQPKLTHL